MLAHPHKAFPTSAEISYMYKCFFQLFQFSETSKKNSADKMMQKSTALLQGCKSNNKLNISDFILHTHNISDVILLKT